MSNNMMGDVGGHTSRERERPRSAGGGRDERAFGRRERGDEVSAGRLAVDEERTGEPHRDLDGPDEVLDVAEELVGAEPWRRQRGEGAAGPHPKVGDGSPVAADEHGAGRTRVLGQVGERLPVHREVRGDEQQLTGTGPRSGRKRVEPGRQVRRGRIHDDRRRHCAFRRSAVSAL